MRKFTISLVPAFVLSLAAAAAAQQGEKPLTTGKDMTDTVKITVSGRVILDYVWRGGEITAFTDDGQDGGPPSGPLESNSENTFEGYLAVGMNIDLSDKVSAVVEFGSKRVDGGTILNWGNTTAELIQLREAHVNLGEFLMPALRLQAGLTTWSFDVRGRGNSFVMDPRHSQSFYRNASVTSDTGLTLTGRAGAPEELEPIGIWARYSRDLITLDFVALPAAIEGGGPQDDEAIYAVDFWYNLDSLSKGSRVGAILALVAGVNPFSTATPISGADTSVFTLGGGVSLNFMDAALNVYGEVYLQFGDAGSIAGSTVDAGGMAFQGGVTYTFAGDMKPWVGFNLTYLSGDDDAPPTTDDEAGAFLSYENINDLIILEDMYFGFDWDTNMFALKFSGGIYLNLGAGKNNLALEGILGIVRTAEEVEFATGDESALGNELDFKARWIITKQASLSAAIGLLFGSNVMEESIAASNGQQDDSAILYTFGADLRF